MAIDVRKPLNVLRQEWETCTRCNLGETRKASGGAFVFGEGTTGCVMFIGEGPGTDENETGTPFSGDTGRFLRKLLDAMGIRHYYLTNCVSCRSFTYQYDGEGHQKYYTRRGVTRAAEQDSAPTPAQRNACLPRLFEEIYLVDPILVVTLGGTAAEAVLGRPVKILQESGKLRPDAAGEPGTILKLPGAGFVPQLTPKGAWRRKVRGEVIQPTTQATVTYPVIPLLHPGFVLKQLPDKAIGSPRHAFATGLSKVRDYYNHYMRVVYGEAMPTTVFTAENLDIAAYEED